MGLLPGIVVALAIVLAGMALLLLGQWWALVAALALLIGAAAAIMLVVIALTGEADESLRRRIPGLGPRRPAAAPPGATSAHRKVAAAGQTSRAATDGDRT